MIFHLFQIEIQKAKPLESESFSMNPFCQSFIPPPPRSPPRYLNMKRPKYCIDESYEQEQDQFISYRPYFYPQQFVSNYEYSGYKRYRPYNNDSNYSFGTLINPSIDYTLSKYRQETCE